MSNKTLAMKVLDGNGILYVTYEYTPSIRDANLVAEQVGVPADQVYKTLVVVGPTKKSYLAMIPADQQLNLKKLAKVLGLKKVKMASHKEAEMLTGLQVGGISALGLLNRGFIIFADRSIVDKERVLVSAGKKGIQIELSGADLIMATGAKVVSLVD